MKKSLILLLLLMSLSRAKMINAIAVVVDGEPITTAEITAIAHQAGVSKKKATELLIQDRLQKAAIKDIVIDESMVDQEIRRIAQQNHVSVQKMQKIITSQGIPWRKYREHIRTGLKKRKFFREQVAGTLPTPSEATLKHFYTTHKANFKLPSKIGVIKYQAPTMQVLEAFIQGKKRLKGSHQLLSTKRLSPALLPLLMQTPIGSFTTPLNAGGYYVMYKVLSKTGMRTMPYAHAKHAILLQWQRQQQEQALKDYFQKMRTAADIRYLR